ncbi:MAG: IS481 family transposase, partial [Chroococcidiopsidaceae cyanobacterium CP_BM_RX_35]|nr:IS481 family transposase [Chroococcidiopsidaceae cyanobacterium CP_BM_RX_35]
ISRPTLRKWIRRYEHLGLEGLKDQSRRPKSCAPKKVLEQPKAWILELRAKRNLGARRIQSELLRLHGFSLSLATIHKVLTAANVKPLKATRRLRKGKRRYQKDIPGERVQMDVCKIGPKLYQYTAIDDCTRFKVIKLYPNKTAASTVAFIDSVMAQMPFPIQRFQTDRGEEFMAHKVQRRLMKLGIKFRPNKPRSPHLNGKVERTQRTDLEEFYCLVDLKSTDLSKQLQAWQDYYNHQRKHGSLNQTPWLKWQLLQVKTPTQESVRASYDLSSERIRHRDYRTDIGKPRKVICL